jgi:hypothetical protein
MNDYKKELAELEASMRNLPTWFLFSIKCSIEKEMEFRSGISLTTLDESSKISPTKPKHLKLVSTNVGEE